MADTLFVEFQTIIHDTWINPCNNHLYQGKNPSYVSSTGSANAYVVTLPNSLLETLENGQLIWFTANFANTGAATLEVVGASSTTALPLRAGGSALVAGEIQSGAILGVAYLNSVWHIIVNTSASRAEGALKDWCFALSDEEGTAITTGTGKFTFRMPWAGTLVGVKASLATASSSGVVTVDINESGTTLLSTKLTIDANEKTSSTAATPAVISDSALADDAEITMDIDTAGTNAAGLKVYMTVRKNM